MYPAVKAALLIGLLAVGVNVYIGWSPPTLSPQVEAWKNQGHFYLYNNEQYIFYRDIVGEGSSDEVLVCLHGFPTSSYDWSRMIGQLKQRFGRIIAPDFLGLGFSSKPFFYMVVNAETESIEKVYYNYTIVEQADMVVNLLVHLQVKSLHILAHDIGDTVCQEILHRYNTNVTGSVISPFSIRSVCLTNGGIFPDTHIPTSGQQLLVNPILGPIGTQLMNKWLFSRSLSAVFGAGRKPAQAELDDWWAILRYNDGNLVLGRMLYYIEERRVYQDKWTNALRNAVVPVHMIYGLADPVNPPPFAEIYKKRLPKASITTLPDDVGHYVTWEAPGDVIVDYWKFVDGVSNSLGGNIGEKVN